MKELTLEELLEKLKAGEVSEEDKKALLEQFTEVVRAINETAEEVLSEDDKGESNQ